MIETARLLRDLKNKQYSAIVHSDEYKSLLTEMCRKISDKSRIAPIILPQFPVL